MGPWSASERSFWEWEKRQKEGIGRTKHIRKGWLSAKHPRKGVWERETLQRRGRSARKEVLGAGTRNERISCNSMPFSRYWNFWPLLGQFLTKRFLENFSLFCHFFLNKKFLKIVHFLHQIIFIYRFSTMLKLVPKGSCPTFIKKYWKLVSVGQIEEKIHSEKKSLVKFDFGEIVILAHFDDFLTKNWTKQGEKSKYWKKYVEFHNFLWFLNYKVPKECA